MRVKVLIGHTISKNVFTLFIFSIIEFFRRIYVIIVGSTLSLQHFEMIFRWSLMIAALLLYQMDSDKQLSAMAFNYVICCRKPNVTTFNGVDKCMDVKLHHQIDKVSWTSNLSEHTSVWFFVETC